MYHNHRRRSLVQQLVALIVTTALLLQSAPLFAAPAFAVPRTNNATTTQTKSNTNTTAADTAEPTLLTPPAVPNGLDARAMALHNRTLATTLGSDFALSINNAPAAADLPLQPGWHLISLPEQLPTTDPSSVLASIDGNYSRVYAYDGCDATDPWKLYDPANPAGSDLTAIDHTMGLWIEMTAAATLAVNGVQLNTASIPLCQGWNLIGYPIAEARLVDQALASIAGGYSRVFGFELTDVADPWVVFDPAVPTWANDLAFMEAGQGYWLYADAATTLTLTPPNTDAPVVEITAPTVDAVELNGQIAVIGTVDDADLAGYTVTIAPVYQSEETVIATGSTVIIDGQLGLLDTTLLANGLYILTLTATDSDGNVSTVSQPIQVQGGANKPGNFSITFTDLEVPVSGIPMIVRRTYDSRKRSLPGDFGYGWRLEIIQAGDYVNNRPPGDGWAVTAGGGTFNPPCTNVHELKSHITEVRFSDLEYYRFALQINMYGFSSAVSGGCLGDASYVQVAGVPGASLTPLGSADVLWTTGADTILDFETGQTFEPQKVRLQTIDGREFDFDLDNGVERIADANGNALFISENGVVHSSGKSLSIVRNGAGQVTEIIDPLGNSILYGYNANTELTGVTDRNNNTTTFAYSSDHFLTDIIDPLGNVPLRNEYDSSGRLVAHIDAAGNRREIDSDLAANQSTITDREGVISLIEYDDNGFLSQATVDGESVSATYDNRGNRLTDTNALGDSRSYNYDANDNLLTRTDELGNTVTRTFTPHSHVATHTDAVGNVTTYSHDSAGNLLTVRDDNNQLVESYSYDGAGNVLQSNIGGIVTTHTYDSFGNRTRLQGANGQDESFTYDANGNLLTHTVKRTTAAGLQSETTTYTYDANGNRLTTTDPLGNVASTTYNARNERSTTTDARGNTTTYAYDSRGNRTRENFCDGTFVVHGYDLEDRRTAVTDQAGRTTFFAYDNQGRLTTITYPDGSTMTQSFDAAGNLLTVTDERGQTTSYQYNAKGWPTQVTDPLGNVTTMSYNGNGALRSTTDALGRVTQYSYDEGLFARRNLLTTTFADGSTRSQSYTADDQPATKTDEAGHTIAYTYDGRGNLATVTDALGGETSYSYDQLGNQLSQTDANGNTTTETYDANGNLRSRTLPLGMTESFTYDANGNQLSHTDFNGQTTTFAYDCLNRLTRKTLPGGAQIDYTYTPTGRIHEIVESRGTTTHSYDVRNRLTQVTHPDGSTISYDYDAAGNRTNVTSPAGSVDYTYDGANRLTTVTTANGSTTYSYDAVGNRAGVSYPNGVSTTYSYDIRHRLTQIDHLAPGGALLESFHYTLGATGNRTRLTEGNGRIVDYTYDALYRLTGETDAAGGTTRTTQYTYDAVGNRLTETTNGTTTNNSYDANDRLLSADTTTYAYDDNGSLRTRTVVGSGSNEVTTYAYDGARQLQQQTAPDGTITQFAYDAHGILRQQIVAGVTTDYVIDHIDNSGLAQVLAETDSTGTLLAAYVYGDERIAMQRGGVTHFYHADGIESVRLLTDSTGNATDTYRYDAFGNLLAATGSTVNDYRFTGERYDANTGFYYLRARFYSPTMGRFINRDSWGGNPFEPGTLHKYAYALNDPANLLDPTGNFASLSGISAAVSISSILSSISVTVMKAAVTLYAINVFIEPGLQLRDLARDMMGSGGLGPNGWQGAFQIYRGGSKLIEAGSGLVGQFNSAMTYVEIGMGFANLANAIVQPRGVHIDEVGVQLNRQFAKDALRARTAFGKYYANAIRVNYSTIDSVTEEFAHFGKLLIEVDQQFFRIVHYVEPMLISS